MTPSTGTAPQPPMHSSRRGALPRLQRGDRLGLGYVIEGLVGRGGMAEIYAAYHEHLGKRVAIKVLQEQQEKSEAILRGLKREARLLASMPRHDNLVWVMDSAIDPQRKLFFVVMELLEGKTLREYIDMRRGRESPFSVREAVTIGLTLARTLHDLHAASYYHRDLKPENVFIQKRVGDRPATLKLLDLGAALAPSIEDLRTQEETRCIGTPAYMSPEQITHGTITARSDIYSLGFILYELLLGRGAWADRNFDPKQYVMSITACQLHQMPTPLIDCVHGMDRELSDIVARMMAKDPSARYGSCREVAAVLTAFLKKASDAGMLKDAVTSGRDVFVEALIAAPRSEIPSSAAHAHLPPPPLDPMSGPATTPDPTPRIPLPHVGGEPAQVRPPVRMPSEGPTQGPRIEKTANSNEGILAQAGLSPTGAPLARGGKPGPAKGTMRMEINQSGPVAAVQITGGLRLEKLTSPDEAPDAQGVQNAMLRELLHRLPPRDAVLEVDSLVVVEGPEPLLRLRFPIEFVALKIGRARESNIVIPHVTVSRTHCGLFAVVDGVFEVVDTGSSYGIEVNDIPTQRATLRARSRLRVGDVVLQLVRGRTKPPDLREARAYNSLLSDPSISAYVSDAVQSAGGVSRATVASSRDRHRFERAATGLPPSPGNDSISVLALGKPSMSSLLLEGDATRTASTPGMLLPTERMDPNARFRPGPSALLRGGSNPWRQSEAKLTHDYFDADTFPAAMKAELVRGNRATLEHLTASQAELGVSGFAERLADCLFMINEHTARLELLTGTPPGKVYQDRLAQTRDWDAAAKTIVDRVVALRARDRQSRVVLLTVAALMLVGVSVLVYFLVLRSK